MNRWVVFKSSVYKPENEVYFFYEFDHALDFMDDLNGQHEDVWSMAEIFPEDKWWAKLILFFSRKGRNTDW